ncbi:MAG: sensor histidine kinase [Cytophagia bacterium]|nr:MAG: sensor histidine kinase [Runella sp.]TAG21412.1 MAG: sensor histidine kinase [Cytophagales bacterium]TAG40765.1 MAG: sensor histidine kinase [Cytophagia bacterium]TAG82156.1 MAG: sensor histidine kinase [Cytophagales bacterium]
MTKFRIQVLIGLMGAAAVGLLAFQWFWIDNALRLRQEQFSLKVTDALQEVVRKLEKQEILYLVQQRQQSEQQRLKLATIDKNNAAKRAKRKQYASAPAVREEKSNLLVETNPTDALTPKNRLLTHGQQQLISDFLKQRAAEDPVAEHFLRMRAEQEKFLNEWFGEFFEIRTQFWESAAQTDSLPNTTLFGNLPNSAQILNKRIRKIKANTAQFDQPLPSALSPQTDPTNQQAQLLKDVFRDLLFGQRPIAHRVNRLMMDSLLKKAFQERSITIPYDFAVRSQRSAEVVFANATFRADTAPNDLFKTALFPNELNTNLSELLVYFPGRRGFILENLGLPLASSIALLAIILGCFYMAVNTILRQKKLAQVKNDFVNNMTHEFKTPISTIALAVEMAREQISDALPNKLNRYLNIVKEENKRLGEHVEKVLQMALLERGAVRLNLTTVNVHDVIEKVLNNVGVQLEQRPTEIELEFEATQEYIQADELHLTNILYNLIDNANKYSPEHLHLYIGTRSNEEGVYVRISDHGQGMTKEQLARIFEPFYRVPTGNLHDVKGFGLGLSYVKKMLEAHHGTIEVSSQPNKGSTFELFLPYQKND